MLDSKGSWNETWTGNSVSHKGKFDNPGMQQAEAQKFRKHEEPYAAVGISFFSSVGSCFGVDAFVSLNLPRPSFSFGPVLKSVLTELAMHFWAMSAFGVFLSCGPCSSLAPDTGNAGVKKN
jgi:hypothetical protein